MTKPTRKSASPWWLAVAAWLGVIAFSSTSMAGQDSEQAFFSLSPLLFQFLHPTIAEYHVIHFAADKAVHVFLFAVLAVLLWQAMPQTPWKKAAIVVTGAFVGSCSEFLQSFYPGRDPAVRDVIINTAATALGLAICLGVSRWRRRFQRRAPAEPAELNAH